MRRKSIIKYYQPITASTPKRYIEDGYAFAFGESYPCGYEAKVKQAKRHTKNGKYPMICVTSYEMEKGNVIKSITKEFFKDGELAETKKQTFKE